MFEINHAMQIIHVEGNIGTDIFKGKSNGALWNALIALEKVYYPKDRAYIEDMTSIYHVDIIYYWTGSKGYSIPYATFAISFPLNARQSQMCCNGMTRVCDVLTKLGYGDVDNVLIVSDSARKKPLLKVKVFPSSAFADSFNAMFGKEFLFIAVPKKAGLPVLIGTHDEIKEKLNESKDYRVLIDSSEKGRGIRI